MAGYDIKKIFDVVLAFNNEPDYKELLSIILINMMDITDSDAGTLYILKDNKLHFSNIVNKTLDIFQSDDSINLPPVVLNKDSIQNVCAYAAINNEIVLVDDVYDETSRFNFSGPKQYDKLTGYKTQSMLVLPLCAHVEGVDDVIGVIQLINAIDEAGQTSPYRDIFDPPIIPALAQIAANTLANVKHMNEVRTLFHSMVAVTTQAIDERSPYNRAHTQNVAFYSEMFARYLSEQYPTGHKYHFDRNRIEQLIVAALLHDIGKIITPLLIMDKSGRLGEKLDEVLYRFDIKKLQLENQYLRKQVPEEDFNAEYDKVEKAVSLVNEVNGAPFLPDDKLNQVQFLKDIVYINSKGDTVPVLDEKEIEALSVRRGTLTEEERNIMQDHVVITGRLLDRITFLKYYENVPSWARHHHEFLDGSGYPNQLKGDAIPLEACIITIVDIFDALIASDRPYKPGVPLDRALEILREMVKEGKLHGELVELFSQSKVWELKED